MSDLPPRAAALLEAARRDHNPSEADRERVHAALLNALSWPHEPSQGAQPEAPGLSPPAAASVSFGPKLAALVAALALGGIGVGTWMIATQSRTAEAGRTPAVASALSAHPAVVREAEGAPPRARPDRATLSPDLPSLVETAPGAKAEDRVARRALRTPPRKRTAVRVAPSAQESSPPVKAAIASSPHAAPEAGAATLAATPEGNRVEASRSSALGELVLIRRALGALRAGSPAGALRALAEHRAQYPDGVMLSEREGLEVVALCEDGQSDAGLRHRATFLQRFPASPVTARVRAACKGDAP